MQLESAAARPPIEVRPRWRGYLAALVITLAMLGLRMALHPVLGAPVTFTFAFPAVMISALVGGFGPALVSTLVSVVTLVALAEGQTTVVTPGSLVRIAVFVGSGVMVGLVAESLHAARARATRSAAAHAEAERTVAAAQERLRAIVDAVPALISYVDRELRYRLVNRAYERWFGRPVAEVEGRLVREVVGRAAWERVGPQLERALGGATVSYESAVPYARGGPRWVQVTYVPDRDERGHVRGVVALVNDVSELKETEHALVRSVELTERRRALATALSQTLTCPQVARIAIEHGLPMVGACAGALAMLSEDDASLELLESEGFDAETVAGWRRVPIDADVPLAQAARTGRIVSVGASASIPLQAMGRTLGVLVLAWSSDAQQRTEEQREVIQAVIRHCALALERGRLYAAEQRAREQAEAASRAKDEFLAMLGHELRNPLAPIITAVELMKLRGDRPAQRERIVIERQAHHLVQLVDDLLDVSRVARGKLELKRAPVEIHEAISRAIEIASPLLEQQRHRLEVRVPRRGLMVMGDPTRLAQIFANLLTNAAKYTDPGGEVRVSAARELDEVVVRVRDTGVGIAPELLPHVFDLFVQGPRGADRSKGGLGLGLGVVSSLVGLHGGEVEAHSEGLGRGSELVVRLPALISEVPSARTTSSATRAETQRAGRRVLVVDDNVDAAEMLADMLTHAGHETRIALDGPAALGMLERFHPDVAVLDLGLPVMDGYELAQKIREAAEAEPRRAVPRLVALTGYGQPSDRERTRAAGFAAHLVKPVEMKELLAAIDGPRGEERSLAAH